MTRLGTYPLRNINEDAALRRILEGTSTATGQQFFAALVENLSLALQTQGAWVTEYDKAARRLRAMAFWLDGQFIRDYEYNVEGTPCEHVIDRACLVHYADNVVSLFPRDPDLARYRAVSYMGVPLLDLDGGILGHLAVLDTRPMPEEPRVLTLFRIFAARAAAELQRLRAESEIREREEQLGRLVDSAMDAILQLDAELKVVLMNPAAEKVLGCTAEQVVGRDFRHFLSPDSRQQLATLIGELSSRPEGQRYIWIPEGLRAICPGGRQFPAEATLSRFELRRRTFYTLILRNIDERFEAERRIRSLLIEAECLREQIRSLNQFEWIIGQSAPMLRLMRDVMQVAGTSATVLILGETGTGKELIARAIHASSLRCEMPLIKVNCAAIPATLIESEFFGHEKGAFTGATQKREGRFAMADGGTIFLDEIGELPLDLQTKLLRVLQEGEFEPVGSSHTRRVDVRIIAATNRDLAQAVREGKFREDLYYRLNVFPISVPPLRDRSDDIALLASAFTKQAAQKLGRKVEPPSQECLRRLKAYSWPGNVRELENVIERAVITSQNGRLNLDRALPETIASAVPETDASETAAHATPQVHTICELNELERKNLILALESTGWKVAGERGAARLLGLKPSTLTSRMKSLGIKRPR